MLAFLLAVAIRPEFGDWELDTPVVTDKGRTNAHWAIESRKAEWTECPLRDGYEEWWNITAIWLAHYEDVVWTGDAYYLQVRDADGWRWVCVDEKTYKKNHPGFRYRK